MTIEEWEKRMDTATDEAEIKSLLRNKPKEAKTIRTGAPMVGAGDMGNGVGVLLPGDARGDLPLLNRLTRSKK